MTASDTKATPSRIAPIVEDIAAHVPSAQHERAKLAVRMAHRFDALSRQMQGQILGLLDALAQRDRRIAELEQTLAMIEGAAS